MRIGLDLDNTIICYDSLFRHIAEEKGLLGEAIGATKGDVKAWVQSRHGNDVWTELQGEVYGIGVSSATAYPGALEFVRHCREAGHTVHIISHKTQFPARGKNIDLRVAALDWLKAQGWFDRDALKPANVEFHDTRADKIAAIARHSCDVFVDDLSEVFHEPSFPAAVTCLLFDSESVSPDSKLYLRTKSWTEISQALFFAEAKIHDGENSRPLGNLVAELLHLANLPPARAMLPIQGGRNNKVFRISTAAGDVLFKSYFHHPRDPRNRLVRELDFLNHLMQVGSSFQPRPLASLPLEQVALMEFIHGRRPSLDEIDDACIDQAIAFFLEANRQIDRPRLIHLEPASEACFSIAEHLARTKDRILRFDRMVREDEMDAEAAEFVRKDLKPAWSQLCASIEAKWPVREAFEATLPQAERCLSPSDFGFHNSLRQQDGRLRFLDFEYAGWDDPAKLIADFANQPDMLLARHLSDRFRSAVIAANANPESLTRRVTALEPLYQIKWACICLNDFLDSGRTRLEFTHGSASDSMAVRKRQLARARQMLARATMGTS